MNTFQVRGAAMPDQRRLCLFLDIDGVMHSIDDSLDLKRDAEALRVALVRGHVSPQSLGLLCPARQQLLVDILEKHRHVDLVVSSAWRAWSSSTPFAHSDDDPLFEARHVGTLDWLKRLLHPVISSRIIGRTGYDETRLDEIRALMPLLNSDIYTCRWVAVDDQPAHFPPHLVSVFYEAYAEHANAEMTADTTGIAVIVDGKTGLTPRSAQQLDAALTQVTSLLDDENERTISSHVLVG